MKFWAFTAGQLTQFIDESAVLGSGNQDALHVAGARKLATGLEV